MDEVWINISERPEYKISNFGSVIGCNGNLMIPQLDRGGYHTVLVRRGKPKHLKIHRLVACAFIPNPYNFPQVNHKDGNKTNNHVSNLEWCDRSYNQKHAFKIGLNSSVGVKNSQSKLSEEDVRLVRFLYMKGLSRRQLGHEFNVTKASINMIVNKKTWAHI